MRFYCNCSVSRGDSVETERQRGVGVGETSPVREPNRTKRTNYFDFGPKKRFTPIGGNKNESEPLDFECALVVNRIVFSDCNYAWLVDDRAFTISSYSYHSILLLTD